ncbi:MAG TPA: CBS domain-containing protein [Chthoniobacterales bacterium]
MDVSGNIAAVLGQKNREIFSVTPDTCVDDAVKMMDEKNVGALLVMKGDKLVGMLSERDYTRKVMLRGKKSSETKVSEIMSSNLTVTHPNEGVDECLRAMTDKRFRHMPVLDEKEKVIGVISIGDLVKYVISCQSAAIAHLESYISGGYSG